MRMLMVPFSNVQVTLQIVKALIEKLPRELPLYAPYILRIIGTVLNSKDLSMVEESVPAFDTFCKHHDVATLAADQEHISRYEDIVKTYASYAALKTPIQPKGGLNASVSIRWRAAGLQALKSVTASEAVGADGGKQLNIIMPVILQNLHSGEEGHLLAILQRMNAAEATEKEAAMRRRMSTATVQTTDGISRPGSAVTGTADDADRLAEEEVGMLAIQGLKQIYTTNNRAQIRLSTGAMLKFICQRIPHRKQPTPKNVRPGNGATWATALVEMVTRWTPVQDRFVILVTIMETFVRSPIAEENLEQQLLLISLVDWLLRSSINMIGLSVMDVLLGLVQHVLLLLQLGGRGSNVLPWHQQTDAIDLFQGATDMTDGPKIPVVEKDGVKKEEFSPSSNRQDLLTRLQRCIGDLAVHIYYSDQISDIIQAILLRLKPSPMSSVSSTAAAIEHPQAAAQAISSSVHLRENPDTDEFFSFGTARVTALKAIKEVLTVANSKGSVSGAAAIGRNRVGVQVWEGTQWLLRDEDRRVRRAYVDALLTWLRLEMSSNDLRVLEDKRKLMRTASKMDVSSSRRDTLNKRATSNASKQDKKEKPTKSTFLDLLHLAIYDNAIESPEAEDDILLLHLLLYHLVEKLGVNAAKTGLPMMIRLQEDINVDALIPTPQGKLNVGSLCHGYFWTMSNKFDFETSTVGYVVQSEIQRRKQHGLWIDTVQMPPMALDEILSAAARPQSEKLNTATLATESVKPFDGQSAMVERIAESYASSVASPPSSPPLSPGRVFSMPILSAASASQVTRNPNELPVKIKEVMLSQWSKQICIAAVEKEVSRTVSVNGSKRGKNLSQHFGINGHDTRHSSPNGAHSPAPPKPSSDNDPTAPPLALNFALQKQDLRWGSAHDTESPTRNSSTDQNTTLRVDDLKRVLAGGALTKLRTNSPLRHNHNPDPPLNGTSDVKRPVSSGSESAITAEGFESASEGDLSRPLPPTTAPKPLTQQEDDPKSKPPPPAPITIPATKSPPSTSTHSRNTSSTHPRSRPHSGYSEPATPRSLRRPSTSSSAAGEDPEVNAAALRGELPSRLSAEVRDEVPPVPPLPAGVAPAARPASGVGSAGGMTSSPEKTMSSKVDGATVSGGVEAGDREVKRSSRGAGGGSNSRKRGVDVSALLGSIDAVAGDRGSKFGGGGGGMGMGRPPY